MRLAGKPMLDICMVEERHGWLRLAYRQIWRRPAVATEAKAPASQRKQPEEGRQIRSGAVVVAEVEFDVEFAFEEIGAAFGIAKIFGDIAASVDFERDSAALEGGTHGLDALAMGVVESLGDAD